MAYNTIGAPLRAIGVPDYGGQQQAQQAEIYRQQSDAATAAKQQQLNQTEVDRMQMLAMSRASDSLPGMMADTNNSMSNNGTDINVLTPGGSGGGSGAGGRGSGGVAIGGGIYPDVSALMAQYRQNIPQVQAPAQVGQPSVPSTSGAFAHAKDVAGRQGNKAIEALNNLMTRRGMSDSGMAAEGAANILGGVGRQQADAEYQAANTDNTRQWEANQLGYQGQMAQNAMGYQGGIAQRGQDVESFLNLLRQLY